MLKVFVDQYLQPSFEEITSQFKKKVLFGFEDKSGIPQEAWDVVVLSDRFFEEPVELEKTKAAFPFAQVFFLPISKASPSIHDPKVFIYENRHTLVNNCVSLIQWIAQTLEYKHFFHRSAFSDHPFFHGPVMHLFLRQLRQREWTPYPLLLVSEKGINREVYAQYLFPNQCIRTIHLSTIPRSQLMLSLFGDDFASGIFFRVTQGLFLDDLHCLDREDLALLYSLLTNRGKEIGVYTIPDGYPIILGAEMEDQGEIRLLKGMVETVEIPSIRQRKEDIPYILNKLVNDQSQKMNRPLSLDEDHFWKLAQEFPWAGNEEEMVEFAQKVVVEGPLEALQTIIQHTGGIHSTDQIPKLNPFLQLLRENVERILVEKAMSITEKNRKKAASLLGISYKSLCKKIKEAE